MLMVGTGESPNHQDMSSPEMNLHPNNRSLRERNSQVEDDEYGYEYEYGEEVVPDEAQDRGRPESNNR